MDVVADAGAVGRQIIGAEDIELGMQPEHGFDSDLDEMRGGFGRLSGAALRIGAGDVEVPQDDGTSAGLP